MKKFFKKHYKLLILIASLLLVGFICIIVAIFNKEEVKPNKEVQKYTAYIKINPLVKLNFSIEDDKAIINDYELVNEDAKNIYKDIKFKGKSIIEIINQLGNKAKEQGIDFDTISIYTDWKTNNIKKSDISFDMNINVIDKDKLKDKLEELKKKETYTITFDTDGGSLIENQTVEEKGKVTKPNDPTKDGFIFKEWQLEGSGFNFDTSISKNITLKATWEAKPEEKEPTPSQNNNHGTNNNNNSNSNNNNNSSNQGTTTQPPAPTNKYAGKYVDEDFPNDYILLNNDNTCYYNITNSAVSAGQFACTYKVSTYSGNTWIETFNNGEGYTFFLVRGSNTISVAVGEDENGKYYANYIRH